MNVCDMSAGTNGLNKSMSKGLSMQAFIQNDSFQVIVGFDKANNFINAMSHILKVVDS